MSILGSLVAPKGANRRKKRLGCGPGSGHGKTATRGTKGAKARSGVETSPGFEGGQMPFRRRIPKRGFTNLTRKIYAPVNLFQILKVYDRDVFDEAFLISWLRIPKHFQGIKLLSVGDVTRPITIRVSKASKAAIAKVEKLGGRVELIHA
jgi:large subunit ribosomal protein L15